MIYTSLLEFHFVCVVPNIHGVTLGHHNLTEETSDSVMEIPCGHNNISPDQFIYFSSYVGGFFLIINSHAKMTWPTLKSYLNQCCVACVTLNAESLVCNTTPFMLKLLQIDMLHHLYFMQLKNIKH